MTSNPLVSAIIPTFNRPILFKRAIESIEDQTYDNIEIIVIETPPKRNASDVTEHFDMVSRPITHVRTNPGVGVSESRNIGLKHASGEYIAFLDDDDVWLPEKTAVQVERLEASSKNISACITGNRKIDTDGNVISVYIPPIPENVLAYQLCWNIGSFSVLMISRQVHRKIGKIDENFDRREDQDFLLRIAKEFDFTFINQPLVNKQGGREDHLGLDYQACRKANRQFRKKHGDLANRLGQRKDMEFSFEFTLGRTALNNGAYRRARIHFLKAAYLMPLDSGPYKYLSVAIGGKFTHYIAKIIHRKLSKWKPETY